MFLISCGNPQNKTHKIKNGFYTRTFYIHSDTVRYEYNYKDDYFDGYLKTYFNGKLIKSQYIENKYANGEYKIYYLNGNLMYDGIMKDGALCYIKKFDEDGILKNEIYCLENYAQMDGNIVNIYFDFFINYALIEPKEFAYSFYRITDKLDTINLIEDYCNVLELDTSLFVIPFEFEQKGKYLCTFAITDMKNHEYYTTLYDMMFEFDKKGVLISDDFKFASICIDLKYPYTVILDTIIYNDSYERLLDKADMIIEHVQPHSKYNNKQ
jgi:hypothetical protein